MRGIVLDHPAEEVWAVIRPFDHYAWAGVPGDITIEAGKAGDQVGAVRRIGTAGGPIRQVLLAHSDAQRSYTYALCDPPGVSSNGGPASTAPRRNTTAGHAISRTKVLRNGWAHCANSCRDGSPSPSARPAGASVKRDSCRQAMRCRHAAALATIGA